MLKKYFVLGYLFLLSSLIFSQEEKEPKNIGSPIIRVFANYHTNVLNIGLFL